MFVRFVLHTAALLRFHLSHLYLLTGDEFSAVLRSFASLPLLLSPLGRRCERAFYINKYFRRLFHLSFCLSADDHTCAKYPRALKLEMHLHRAVCVGIGTLPRALSPSAAAQRSISAAPLHRRRSFLSSSLRPAAARGGKSERITHKHKR